MTKVRAETVTQFIRREAARAGVYHEHLGADIAGRLAHHAEQMAYHHRAYTDELTRIRQAAREVGIDVSSLRIPEEMWRVS